MSISDEQQRLAIVRSVLASAARAPSSIVAVADMDDAALVRISDTHSLVVASDFVRGSGFILFQLGYMNYYDVGYYLVAANVSDLAAMGARTIGLTSIVRYTDAMTDEQFTSVFEGMRDAASVNGAEIVGGDIGSYEADVFAATAFGFIETKKALLRKNARPGDVVCVTGVVGRPITALTYFKELKPHGVTLTASEEDDLLLSWRRPRPRVDAGVLLSEHGLANACQDISDGLTATVQQLSAITGLAFTIYADRVPLDPTTEKLARLISKDPISIAMSASVDFELLFTLPPERKEVCRSVLRAVGIPWFQIGEVKQGDQNVLVRSDGSCVDLPGVAWRHQTGDYLKEILHGSSPRDDRSPA